MVKNFFVALLFVIPILGQGQLTMSIQLPPSGLIQKDQLWNLVLVNNTAGSLDITVMLTLQEQSTGQTVLSGSSRVLNLAKGVKTISIKDVQPVQYNYGMSTFSGNYLPLGTYLACYTILKNRLDAVETIAQDCVNITINPLSPPLLNTPADRSILQTHYPQFSWTPPTPIQMFDNLNYEISVVEVHQGQSPTDAIKYNTPLYSKTNTLQPFEIYPSTYSTLDTGKIYAWQVTARNGLNYTSSTEVWTFSLLKDSLKTQNLSGEYILIKSKNEAGGVHYIKGDYLLVKFYSFDKPHETIVRFYTSNGKLIKRQKQKLIYGDNFLRIELGKQFDQNQVYRIEIADLQNHIYTANFIISKPTN